MLYPALLCLAPQDPLPGPSNGLSVQPLQPLVHRSSWVEHEASSAGGGSVNRGSSSTDAMVTTAADHHSTRNIGRSERVGGAVGETSEGR